MGIGDKLNRYYGMSNQLTPFYTVTCWVCKQQEAYTPENENISQDELEIVFEAYGWVFNGATAKDVVCPACKGVSNGSR